jgi:hypothetical protein
MLIKTILQIQIDNRTVQDVISNAHEVLAMTEREVILIFPDVRKIRTELLRQLNQEGREDKPTSRER